MVRILQLKCWLTDELVILWLSSNNIDISNINDVNILWDL